MTNIYNKILKKCLLCLFCTFLLFVPYVPGPLQEAIWILMGGSETFASSWPC